MNNCYHSFNLHSTFWLNIVSYLIPVKYLNFGQKLTFWTICHTFLESRHPKVTKTPYYILSPEGSQKKVSAHGLYALLVCHTGIQRQGVVIITASQLHSTKPEIKTIQQKLLCRFKSYTRRVRVWLWWGSLAMVPAGNKAKRLPLVNHTTKTIHHHHNHHHHHQLKYI